MMFAWVAEAEHATGRVADLGEVWGGAGFRGDQLRKVLARCERPSPEEGGDPPRNTLGLRGVLKLARVQDQL